MSGKLSTMPLDDVQQQMGALIEEAKNRSLPMSQHFLLSVSEYLKDAARWRWVRDNHGGLPEFASPQAVQDHVDFLLGGKDG